MKPAILFVALLFAVILIQTLNRTSVDPDADLVARLALLEARTERLAKRLAHLEQSAQAAPATDQPAAATAPTSTDAAVDWRFGVGLEGQPLRVAAKTFDQHRGRIEILLEINAPLSDADAWPREPGLPVPVMVIARDSSGAVAAEQPLTLMRGPSQEPGAYLHLGAELSAHTADRVQVIELRRSRP